MHDVLHLDNPHPNTFLGICSAGGRGRAYGGHIAAQALLAAHRTVAPDRAVHSLHGYFLSMGRPGEPVQYDVHPVREGGTYALRQVSARQHGNEIFTLTASFKTPETDTDRHVQMPPAPDPATLPPRSAAADRLWSGIDPSSPIRRVVDVRPVQGDTDDDIGTVDHGGQRRRMWFRIRPDLPDDPALHAAALTYCSDLTVARTAALGHLRATGTAGTPAQTLYLASLDHAIWFHRPCRADDWLLFVHHSPTSGDGRGLTTAQVWTRDGALVATVNQEVLLRSRRPTTSPAPVLVP
ncbi:thioesterase family protein [Rhodococcus pseudokoreensis]|uniref:Thioesterase family protein n=1 Tax=Rhodococcus pseudokoreensis TaxID=2811421 RepID=A0A974W7F0_9NOCA|nr:acyl-CoA thioesterase domain-containing protein [Rhodococcus pseudokoreensis]QSE92479.1 thioesterase family protein [Rhodococcus pseudokoreensis]